MTCATMPRRLAFLALLALSQGHLVWAASAQPPVAGSAALQGQPQVRLKGWFKAVRSARKVSFEAMLKNISPSYGARGSVTASPSEVNPNYRFDWTRDSSMAMRTVLLEARSTK